MAARVVAVDDDWGVDIIYDNRKRRTYPVGSREAAEAELNRLAGHLRGK